MNILRRWFGDYPFGRPAHLFIHRRFGGGAHPRILRTQTRLHYPRLLNTVGPLFVLALVLHSVGMPEWVEVASRWLFAVATVALFLYQRWFPLNHVDWYEIFERYWDKRGFRLTERPREKGDVYVLWEVSRPGEPSVVIASMSRDDLLRQFRDIIHAR